MNSQVHAIHAAQRDAWKWHGQYPTEIRAKLGGWHVLPAAATVPALALLNPMAWAVAEHGRRPNGQGTAPLGDKRPAPS